MLSRFARATCSPAGLARRAISVEAQHLNATLASQDPEMTKIVELEKERQRKTIVMIASENFTSKAVMETVGSVMTNKYSEGYPGARYYGGNKFIDQAELLAQTRARETFGLSADEWGVNVQTLSGSPANMAVYTSLLNVHDRILALDLPHGGHLSHGFQLRNKKISMVSKFFEPLPYRLNVKTGIIDYDEVEWLAERYNPKLIICGASAYSRHIDFARFRQIADKVGAILHCDMAHIAGLVAAGLHPSPFPHVDVVTTTTHKTLRGPRGAMIFMRKGQKGQTKDGTPIMYDLETKINESVFPGLNGGPHNHSISGVAVMLKQAQSPEFKQYQGQVLKNSKALADGLLKRGHELVSGGTDNHLVLVNLKAKGITGAKGEKICDLANIAVNKNTVPGDKSAMNPSGLRLGAPAMTSRGLLEKDYDQIAEFIDRACNIALEIQEKGHKKLVDFNKVAVDYPAVHQLRADVEAFTSQFEVIGQ